MDARGTVLQTAAVVASLVSTGLFASAAVPRHAEGSPSPSAAAVELVPTTTGLAAWPNPSEVGRAVTYTATVSPAPNGGTVDLLDGATPIAGCAAIGVDTATGTATCATAILAAGSHSITASYSGTATHEPSTSGYLTQVVARLPTATTLDSSANPAMVGQAVVYTATVPAAATGTVTFIDEDEPIPGCAARGISAGTAICAIPAYPEPGSHAIFAVYSGDASRLGSTSPGLVETVTAALVTRQGPVAAALLSSYTDRRVSLTSSILRRSRVRILGTAHPSLVGQPVAIVPAGSDTPLAMALVGADGGFRAELAAPARSARGGVRYIARVGRFRSNALLLTPRLRVNPLRVARGTILVTGRVVRPLTQPRSRIVVSRHLGPGRKVVVARARPRANGTFQIVLIAPTTSRAAVYSAATRVRQLTGRDVTVVASGSGLPQVVSLG